MVPRDSSKNERPGPRRNPGDRSEQVTDPGSSSPELYAVQPYVKMPGDPSRGFFIDSSGRESLQVPQFTRTTDIAGIATASTGGIPDRLTKAQAEAAWGNLPAQTREAITNLAKAIDYRKTGLGLWRESIASSFESSKSGTPRSPYEVLNEMASNVTASGGAGGTGGRSGGRAAAYTGPVESITKMAESDIRATADAVAIEILGRGATDEEIKKITQRMRKAETQQPQVTTQQGPGRSTTEQGLTAQGRDDILRDVLSKNPDFEQYQLDTTVMDAMVRFVNKKKAIAGD